MEHMTRWTKFMQGLLAAERAVIMIAALAALVPIWQYWAEREDRNLDRAANFILAFKACVDATNEQLLPDPSTLMSEGERLEQLAIQLAQAEQSGQIPPISIGSLSENIGKHQSLLTSTIKKECDYIADKN